jgi:hypothetical protein
MNKMYAESDLFGCLVMASPMQSPFRSMVLNHGLMVTIYSHFYVMMHQRRESATFSNGVMTSR